MNERIKQLAEEAGFDIEVEDIFKYKPQHSFIGNDENIKKFAELIVRECGEIAYKTYWNNPLEVRGVHFKEAMYKQFGIRYE